MAVYDLARAMAEAAEVIEFAKQHKHPTAYFFAVRHRAHLSGLLVDKIQLETTGELKGALLEVRVRVFGGQGTRQTIRRLTEHNDAQSSARGVTERIRLMMQENQIVEGGYTGTRTHKRWSGLCTSSSAAVSGAEICTILKFVKIFFQ